MTEVNSYSEKFCGSGSASNYDTTEFAENSYSTLLWGIEKSQLRQIMDKFFLHDSNVKHLDFACGTGRIVQLLEDSTATSVGIDISRNMLEQARTRVLRSELIHADLTKDQDLQKRSFDLITSFRFILNAEPDLREKLLSHLSKMLKSNDSIAVINNHGNPYSHKLFMLPFNMMIHKMRGLSREGNYLTHEQCKALFELTGFTVVEHLSCGLFSNKFIKIVGFRRAERCEKFVLRYRFFQGLMVNRMYVLKRANK